MVKLNALMPGSVNVAARANEDGCVNEFGGEDEGAGNSSAGEEEMPV